MRRIKKASDIFREVDPNLRVIDGGIRRTPLRKIKSEDWDKSKGVTCSECGQEAFCIIDGICSNCYMRGIKEREEKLEEKKMRNYYKRGLREGKISLRRMKENRL